MRTNEFLKLNPPESHSWAGKVTFSFSYPKSGWIQFPITCTTYVQGIIVNFSNAFDPFPELVHWLEAIAECSLPSEFLIEEEGEQKLFRATPVNEYEFIFEILDGFWLENEQPERPIYLYVQ